MTQLLRHQQGQETEAENTDGEDDEGSFRDIEFGDEDIEISRIMMADGVE
jgi:hypothetical protein